MAAESKTRSKVEQRGAAAGRKRKERVLHTRISEKLAADITRVADDLRVPVSNLVRNVLEDAFNVAETVTDNVGELINSVLSEAERASDRINKQLRRAKRTAREKVSGAAGDRLCPEFPDVIGWQPLLLNHEQKCADCGVELPRAARAMVGVKASGLSGTYLCMDCLQARV